MRIIKVCACLLAAAAAHSASAGIVVDGNLADWQIDRTTWVSSLPGVYSTIDDQTGSGDYRLNPGWGGQAYDAEAMYATFRDGKLYIALATGHNPLTINDPGRNIYAAGDFGISFGMNGIYDLGINVVNNFAGGELGGVYASPTWAYGLWDVNGNNIQNSHQEADKTHPTSLLGGTLLGLAETSYTTIGETGYGLNTTDKHYFYEISLDLALLYAAGWNGDPFDIHWTQNCANDNIMIEAVAYNGNDVPEPGSLALLGLGMVGMIGLRRRHPA